MPIYEYHCEGCDGEVDIFFPSLSDAETTYPECPECGGTELDRIMSKVSLPKGKRLRDSPEPKRTAVNTEDTKALADAMRKAQSGSRSDMGEDFREVERRLEKGESSASIEKKLRKRVGEQMETH